MSRYPDGPDRVASFIALARNAGKPAVVFFVGDSPNRLPFDEATVFRTSLFRSDKAPNEFAMPGFQEDLLEYVGDLPVRQWSTTARVGFCGYVFRPRPLTGLRRVFHASKRVVFELIDKGLLEDIFVRSRAVDALATQSFVDADVVVRDEGTFFPELSLDTWRTRRIEYVENIARCDYALCARGAGNWSYRLYEVLSLGRIPVFIDTDCVLPYDWMIHWREHCVWLTRREIPHIGEKVAAFHNALSPDEFEERQRACRRLWEDYLSPEGFFAHFHRHFDTYA
jgi:hypothetical protein